MKRIAASSNVLLQEFLVLGLMLALLQRKLLREALATYLKCILIRDSKSIVFLFNPLGKDLK